MRGGDGGSRHESLTHCQGQVHVLLKADEELVLSEGLCGLLRRLSVKTVLRLKAVPVTAVLFRFGQAGLLLLREELKGEGG